VHKLGNKKAVDKYEKNLLNGAEDHTLRQLAEKQKTTKSQKLDTSVNTQNKTAVT
jgi:hypothetical protein